MPSFSNRNNNNSNNNNSSALWHGLGLFGESYLLFSIGTLRPLWEALYPLCFSSNAQNSTCPHAYLTYNSLSYSVVLGVMAGMIIVGILAGRIGRRKGSLLTASIMVGGASILVASSWLLSSNDRPDVLFMVMSASLFVFGIGVGGEYPLSATLASERAMTAMRERRRWEEEKEGEVVVVDGGSGMLSSRLLAMTDSENGGGGGGVDHDEGNGDGGSRSYDHYSWQTTTRHDNNMTQIIEQYNVTQQPQSLSSSEQVQHIISRNDNTTNNSSKTLTRGREVIVVFSMQGMGILANSLILTFLLMITKQKGQQQQQMNYNDDNVNQQQENGNDDDNNNNFYSNQYHNETALLYTWRIIYAIGLAILIYVLISRIRHLNESEVWTQDRLKRDQDELQRRRQQMQVSGGKLAMMDDGNGGGFVPPLILLKDGEKMNEVNGSGQCEQQQQQQEPERQSELQLLFQHYGIRLFGTSITWLLWDIAFYGNKLFQSTFLLALTGENATLTQISGASALNALVALLGYYAAALIVDKPTIGRLRLQQTGFVITGTLFLICGVLNEQLSSTVLVMIYLGSSFFGQCGPNCTTFLIPAEVFPTEMRTVCHGISASAGKLGALIASILFTFAKTDKSLFLISGYTSFAAVVVTFLTIPDLTTLDLYEIDKHWRMILNGNEQEYDGAAVDSKHLSYLERKKHR